MNADAATRLKPRGSSQGGLRQYNERVVLQAIRLHGALPQAAIDLRPPEQPAECPQTLAGSMATFGALGHPPTQPGQGTLPPLPSLGAVTSRSYHPGGVNVLLGDGSVRFVSNAVNLNTWQAASTIDGNDSLGNDW